MRVLILGAGGLIGSHLTRLILDAPGAITALVLADQIPVPIPAAASIPVHSEQGDICDEGFINRLLPGADCVFHLVALLTTETEADLPRGMAVNIGALMRLLEVCRTQSRAPRFVFTSSIAAFGGPLPAAVHDDVPRTPQTSYGTHKAIGELLVDDYTRHGWVDGRVLRLPIVLVRNGPPREALSDRVAALIREPLYGRDVVCGLDPQMRMPVASASRVAEALLQMAAVPAESFGHTRAMNLPSLSVTAAELADAVARSPVAHKGRITWEAEPRLQALVESWPRWFVSSRATRLGLGVDATVDEIVGGFIAENGLT
jgi:nucleoside-diphosphate-sugar epimerase